MQSTKTYLTLLFIAASSICSLSIAQHTWLIPLQDEIKFGAHTSELRPFENIKTFKRGMLNKKGEIVIPANYDFISQMHSNLFRVGNNGYEYVIDKNQNILIGKGDNFIQVSPEFPLFSEEDELMFSCKIKEDHFGIRSLSGKISIEAKYQSLTPINDQLIKFYYNGKYGLLNIHGDTIYSPIYTHIELKDEKYLLLHKSNGSNIFDLNGNPLLPDHYTWFDYLDPDRIVAQKIIDSENSIYALGVIDLSNQLKLDFQIIL